jgi:hypothetical protein
MLLICRPNSSRRVLVWLFVVLATPLTAPAATLEDSARELARKIAGSLTAQDNVVLEVRNASSLSPNEVAQVEIALRGELQNHVAIASTEGEETARVTVTLSENIKELVWTAGIRQGDASRTVLFSAPRPSGNQTVSGAMPVALRAEKFWEGPKQLLDAAKGSDSTGGSWLVLLLPEGLEIQNSRNELVSKVEIPSGQTSTRIPRGSLGRVVDTVSVRLEPSVCTVLLATHSVTECHSASAPASARDPVDAGPAPGSIPPGKGSQLALFRSDCGSADQLIVTGAGDDTQQDSVQLYDAHGTEPHPLSAALYFDGPVKALHSTRLGRAATVVVRNLKTGNYEAYRLSTTCTP